MKISNIYKIASLALLGVLLVLVSMNLTAAGTTKVGVVNLTDLFNESTFVKNANTKLQEEIKKMALEIQDEEKKLQDLVSQYEKSDSKKTVLKEKIGAQQTVIASKNQAFQKKISEIQAKGMQEFSDLVRLAAEKVAKKQKINVVLSSTSLVYSDGTWMDITKEVSKAM